MKQTVGITVVMFSVMDNTLRVYAPEGVLPAKDWTKGVSLEREVASVIKRFVGLESSCGYIEQLYTFAFPNKPVDVMITYYVLIGEDALSTRAGWIDPGECHEQTIIKYAMQRLRWKIEYTNVVYSLLPDAFTLSELQRVYEAILGKPLDKRNFRKKILSLNILKDMGEKKRMGKARPAEIYTFTDHTPVTVEIL